MSRYIQWEEGEPDFLSSNSGWGQFVTWALSLDAKKSAAVRELANTGITEALEPLVAQLATAPKASADVQPIIDTIVKAVAERGGLEVLMVTDGMSFEEGVETKSLNWDEDDFETPGLGDSKEAAKFATPKLQDLLKSKGQDNE